MPDPTTRPRLGLSLTGAISLVSVVCVLVLVSLPRLRDFAVLENTRDARTTVAFLVDELAEHPEAPEGLEFGDLFEPRDLEHALSDLELIEDGRLLRRHGYLFALVPWEAPPRAPEETASDDAVGLVEAAVDRPSPRYAVLAWPWDHGRTGTLVLLAASDGRVWVHDNAAQRWNGPQRAPVPTAGLKGWRRD